jgi:hypothetical protein
MWIRRSEPDPIESIDFADFFEEFTERGLENLLYKGGARRAEDFGSSFVKELSRSD